MRFSFKNRGSPFGGLLRLRDPAVCFVPIDDHGLELMDGLPLNPKHVAQ